MEKSEAGAMVPAATANRLGIYLRELQQLQRAGLQNINSRQLGDRLGLSDSQIRRDLAIFGQFGRRGVGYPVVELAAAIRKILGIDQSWGVVLIGVGNLGTALAGYRGFSEHGFRLVGAFDLSPQKIGKKIAGIEIFSIDRLEELVKTLDVQLAILAVPAAEAISLARRLNLCGVTGILNFAPVTLQLTSEATVVDVDLALELQRLVFAVVSRRRSS